MFTEFSRLREHALPGAGVQRTTGKSAAAREGEIELWRSLLVLLSFGLASTQSNRIQMGSGQGALALNHDSEVRLTLDAGTSKTGDFHTSEGNPSA
jgi:hypothetical protein